MRDAASVIISLEQTILLPTAVLWCFPLILPTLISGFSGDV